jgi:hypothetical protein
MNRGVYNGVHCVKCHTKVALVDRMLDLTLIQTQSPGFELPKPGCFVGREGWKETSHSCFAVHGRVDIDT